MKKGLAIGAIAITALLLIGCQPKPVEQAATTTPPAAQKATSTATVDITGSQQQSVSTTAQLEIKPAEETQQASSTADLKITP